MNTHIQIMTTPLFALTIAFTLLACAEDGEEGDAPIDCGEFGSEHDGHCDCNDGYLFDGSTCVEPSDITTICVEEEEEEGEEEHQHPACLCPDEGECPCDHGEVVTHGDHDYCVPEEHEE